MSVETPIQDLLYVKVTQVGLGHASTCGACTYCSLRGKVEKYPAEINYMTGDPRLVSAETPIQDLPSMQTRQLSRSTLDLKIVYKRKQLHV